MRLEFGKLRFLPLAVALAMGGLSLPADAGSPYSDRVYADSFGNLVIHSRAGYKRIVVGAGHLAGELSSYQDSNARDDDVIYLDDENIVSNGDGYVLKGDCWRPAVLLKGRSYMYGLADGELPDLPGKCRN